MSPVARGPALCAVLNDPVVPSRGLDGDAPFMNVVAAWFFDVHIFACLAGPDGDQGVPVIGSGDRYRIDRLVFKAWADILNGRRLAASVIPDLLEPIFERTSVGIDQISDFDAWHLAEF